MATFGIGSDYKTIVTFVNKDGEEINASGVSEAPKSFELEYYTTNENAKKIAKSVGMENCKYETIDEKVRVVVAFDNVDWGEGDVICRATIKYNDTDFPDGERTYVEYIETGDSYERL